MGHGTQAHNAPQPGARRSPDAPREPARHTSARPGFAVDLEALQRDLKYELVETLDHVAYSRDTPHQGIGRSREEALAELRKLAADARDLHCSRMMVRVRRRPRR